jgi:hypothetical protein
MKNPSYSLPGKAPVNQPGNRMTRKKFTFDRSLRRVGVAGVMVSAVLALLTIGIGQVLAADFYVGGDGASDRNSGTAPQPFATIQKAAGVAAAGDFVNIRPGIYRETVSLGAGRRRAEER